MIWTRQGWARDLRHAARSLARSPGFTVVTVGTLGLAIGVNAGMFSVVDTRAPASACRTRTSIARHIAATCARFRLARRVRSSRRSSYVQYKEQSKLIEDVSTYNSFTSTLRAGDRVERIRMSCADELAVLDARRQDRFSAGFRVADDENQCRRDQLRSSGRSWFGGDSAVIGRSYIDRRRQSDGHRRDGPGISSFRMTRRCSGCRARSVPTGSCPVGSARRSRAREAGRDTGGAGANELTALSKSSAASDSADRRTTRGSSRSIARSCARSSDSCSDRSLGPLWVLLGAVAIVLLIACANVANLFMVRAEGRQRDLAVRRAIGAARGQLIRSQMAEALVVAVLRRRRGGQSRVR